MSWQEELIEYNKKLSESNLLKILDSVKLNITQTINKIELYFSNDYETVINNINKIGEINSHILQIYNGLTIINEKDKNGPNQAIYEEIFNYFGKKILTVDTELKEMKNLFHDRISDNIYSNAKVLNFKLLEKSQVPEKINELSELSELLEKSKVSELNGLNELSEFYDYHNKNYKEKDKCIIECFISEYNFTIQRIHFVFILINQKIKNIHINNRSLFN